MYISSFSISGYRSLKNITINKMLPVCILHGLNNSGKSNILSAMEMIFRRKILLEDTTFSEIKKVDENTQVEQVTKQHERVGPFWQGKITNFRDNFYNNRQKDITFSVSVCFTDAELKFMDPMLKTLHHSLASGKHQKKMVLTGKIKPIDDDSAEMILESALFNDKYTIFEVDSKGKKNFFPKAEKVPLQDRLLLFETLMDLLSDSYKLLPSNRYLTDERMSQEPSILPITPKTFKQWLFKLSLSRSGHTTFEEIKTMFANKPFDFGEIGFSKEQDNIEIMVKEKSLRLPIGRLGSGYQQILYIIANLVLNKKKMMGIEELETNLSPTAQKIVFEKLKHHIYQSTDLVSQIIITSHSDYFEGRTDIRRYSVSHDGGQTTVTPMTQKVRKDFFSSSGYRRKLL